MIKAFSCLLALVHGNVSSFEQEVVIMISDSFLSDACAVLTQDIDRLIPLAEKIKKSKSWHEKYEWIVQDRLVKEYLEQNSFINTFLHGLSIECAFVLLSIVAIDQADRVLNIGGLHPKETVERLRELIDCLLNVETFYSEIGGIVGYHLSMIKFLCRPEERQYSSQAIYHPPKMIDISQPTSFVKQAIFHYLSNIEKVAEIYPVGGAADRLKLLDPVTLCPLPAANLHFCGMTLLERLIRDVQVKEFLYYQIYDKQVCIPVAMMTSTEKNNHQRIKSLFEDNQYFHRPIESFYFFCQPSVPTINHQGKWGMRGALQPLLRPGGHGVIWKLARDSGCLDWMKNQNIQKILVRQINNPIAAEDYGLFAFAGLGLKNDHAIGFCSCPRLVKSAEGTNVLIEEQKNEFSELTLTNIEYCDFQKYGIADEPIQLNGIYSKYPSNTNILLIDLNEVIKAIEKTPIPGMLVNLKKISFQDEFGVTKEEPLARLESMMQNIADCFSEDYKGLSLSEKNTKNSFITFNHRSKTISTTKKEYVLGSSLLETPEGCFIDMMQNARDLLNECKFLVLEDDKELKPNFSFLYHPALGPFYSIISQKIQNGTIRKGSEWNLSIADIYIDGLELDGSFSVAAENVMGHYDDVGNLQYSKKTGKCHLKNVIVLNKGIDYEKNCVIWKGDIARKESLRIDIQGDGEFFAENVSFRGNFHIIVKSSTKVTAREENGEIVFDVQPIQKPSWWWKYKYSSDLDVVLEKVEG